jgi:hypothetical protein
LQGFLLQVEVSKIIVHEAGEPNALVGAAAMAEVTYYVALPFVAADDGIAVGNPMECLNPIAVAMRAEALSRKRGHIGAVAFSRTGDPATGDFNDVEVLKSLAK